MKYASIEDIKRLVLKIPDSWTLCEFLPMHEANDIVAQTLHACVVNFNNRGEAFSFLGKGMGYSPTGICNYGSAYDGLLKKEYLVEEKRENKVVMIPTLALTEALDRFLAKEGGFNE